MGDVQFGADDQTKATQIAHAIPEFATNEPNFYIISWTKFKLPLITAKWNKLSVLFAKIMQERKPVVVVHPIWTTKSWWPYIPQFGVWSVQTPYPTFIPIGSWSSQHMNTPIALTAPSAFTLIDPSHRKVYPPPPSSMQAGAKKRISHAATK